jgi:hypothetical protein
MVWDEYINTVVDPTGRESCCGGSVDDGMGRIYKHCCR